MSLNSMNDLASALKDMNRPQLAGAVSMPAFNDDDDDLTAEELAEMNAPSASQRAAAAAKPAAKPPAPPRAEAPKPARKPRAAGAGLDFTAALLACVPIIPLVVLLMRYGIAVVWPSAIVAAGWALVIYATQKATVNAARPAGFLGKYAPQWGVNMASRAGKANDWQRGVMGVISLVLVFILAGMAYIDGYTTIQGVRTMLDWVGLMEMTNTISLWWAALPLVLTVTQLTTHDQSRPLWNVSVILNAVTTAVFVAVAILRAAAVNGHVVSLHGISLVQLAFVSASIGLTIAVLFEQMLLSVPLIIRTTFGR